MSTAVFTCIGLAFVVAGLVSAVVYLAVELRSARGEARWLRSAHRHAREQLREAKDARDRYKRLAERLVTERADALEDWSMQ